MGNQLNACCTSDADGEKQIKFERTPKAMQGHAGFGTGATHNNTDVKAHGHTRNEVEQRLVDQHQKILERQSTKKYKQRGKYGDSSDNETSEASLSQRP